MCGALDDLLAAPLSSNRGGGGVRELSLSVFQFLLRRLHIELLLCVCWLDKVVLLMHCCVLQISCIQGTTLYPVSCRTLNFSQFQPCMSIPVAPIEHVQLFKVKYPQKSGTQSLSLSGAEHASQQGVSGSFCGSYVGVAQVKPSACMHVVGSRMPVCLVHQPVGRYSQQLSLQHRCAASCLPFPPSRMPHLHPRCQACVCDGVA